MPLLFQKPGGDGKAINWAEGDNAFAERGSRLLKGEIVLSRGSLNRQGGAECL